MCDIIFLMELQKLTKSEASRRTIERVNALGLNRGRAIVPVYVLYLQNATDIKIRLVRTENIVEAFSKVLAEEVDFKLMDIKLLSYEGKRKEKRSKYE